MSQALTVARPYARAAFSQARDEGDFAAWSQALGFAARVSADSRVAALLPNPRLAQADAVALLLPEGASESFQRFLAVLAEGRRLPQLPEIAGLYEALPPKEPPPLLSKVSFSSFLPEPKPPPKHQSQWLLFFMFIILPEKI